MDYGSGVYGRGVIGVPAEVRLVPTVSLSPASELIKETAVLNGAIARIGTGQATVRGFYVLRGTEGTPTPADTVISETGLFSEGAFSLPLGGLSADTSYRVVAFATNDEGTTTSGVGGIITGYDPVCTTQAAENIEASSAEFSGTVTDAGRLEVLEEGFYYLLSSTGDPTAADQVVSTIGSFEAGEFTEVAEGLIDASDYRVAAFCRTLAGIAVGETIGITTPNFRVAVDGEIGKMIESLPGLMPSSTYYARAFATNANGTAYGGEVTFKTGSDSKPRVIFMDSGVSMG